MSFLLSFSADGGGGFLFMGREGDKALDFLSCRSPLRTETGLVLLLIWWDFSSSGW